MSKRTLNLLSRVTTSKTNLKYSVKRKLDFNGLLQQEIQEWVNVSQNHTNNNEMIRWVGREKFDVIDMKQSNFYDFNSLLKTKYKKNKKNTNGEKFVFHDVKWMRYVKNHKNTILYKTSLKDEAEFFKLDLTRKNSDVSSLPLAYDEELPITVEKKKDLISLLPLIPDVFHEFYKNLKTKKNLSDPVLSDDE